MTLARLINLFNRHPIGLTLGVALLLLVVFFDWNWFQGPLERYVSKKTQREFTISDLDVSLGLTPTVRMRDVYFSNASWSTSGNPMARIEAVEVSISLRALPDRVLLPRVALTKPDLLMEQLADDRKNWIFSEPDDRSPSKLMVSTLVIDQGQLRYVDHGEPFSIDVKVSTLDTPVAPGTTSASVGTVSTPSKQADEKKPNLNAYTTQYSFSGKYHNAGFTGQALTGEVLSFQQSGVPFPVKGRLDAGATKLEVEGTIADAATLSAIDAQIRIQGQTLANLYPFLLLPLPASPPYQLQGRLVLQGNRYAMDNLAGRIGSSDVSGKAAYIKQEPRPLLTASLSSKLLNIADLGPIVGVQTKSSGGKPAASQANTANRSAAVAAQNAASPDRVLPAGSFAGSRLKVIDAEVDLTAAKLQVPQALPLESLKASLRLKNGVVNLDPLDFGFAGGTIQSRIKVDGQNPVITTEASINLRRVQVAKLVPDNKTIAQGAGLLGASVQLKGTGNSIADAAANANGRLSAAVSNGRISNLLDAASGLNGGRIIRLLAGGDQTIQVNCGGFDFNVKNGVGRSSVFVVDTEQTQILGDGGFNLANETFDLMVTPKPKNMGVLSLRTPVRVHGTFKQPDFELQKVPLLARAGGAVALLAVTPLAALIPLLETGPGEDTNCTNLQSSLSGAQRQAVGAPAQAAAPTQRASKPAAKTAPAR